MNNPTDKPRDNMYEVVFPVPDVTGGDDHLTLVIALGGYADAGHAVTESAEFLLDALEHRPLVNFATDELVDYRSRRPAVTIAHDQIAEVDDLRLTLNVVRDNVGKPFLLLSGPEPDMRWEAFSAAVADLAERYDVGQAVSLYSAPMTVPHTRPLGIITHGSGQRKLANQRRWGGRVTVPGAASLNIEYELNKRGRESFGLTAQVPHYIAASEYPLAALRLLQEVAAIAGLKLPLEALERESARVAELLNTQTNESEDVSQLINLLEEQYDQEAQRRRALETSPLLGPDGQMPSADEIGAEFEKFLATQPLQATPKQPTELFDDAGAHTPSELNELHADEAEHSDAAETNDQEPLDRDADDGSQGPVAPGSSESTETSNRQQASEETDERRGRRGWRPWFRF